MDCEIGVEELHFYGTKGMEIGCNVMAHTAFII